MIAMPGIIFLLQLVQPLRKCNIIKVVTGGQTPSDKTHRQTPEHPPAYDVFLL